MTLDELDPEEEQEAAEGYVGGSVSDHVEEWLVYREELFEYATAPPTMESIGRKTFFDPFDYERLYGRVREDMDVDYTTEDVEEFVLRGMDAEYEEYEGWEAKTVGMFSSSLVQLLSEETEGETSIRVNGGGRRFDYLFYGLQEAGTVVVEDVSGDSVLRGAGSYGGEIGTLVMEDVEGRYAGADIGRNGRVGTAVLRDVSGYHTATNIGTGESGKNYMDCRLGGHGGDVDLLVLSGIDRSPTPNNLGIGGGGGRIRNLVLDDIELMDGYQVFTGRDGYFGTALFRDVEGEMEVEAGELVDLEESDRFDEVAAILDGMRSGGSLLQDVERLEEVLDLSWPRRLKRWVQWAV